MRHSIMSRMRPLLFTQLVSLDCYLGMYGIVWERETNVGLWMPTICLPNVSAKRLRFD